MPVLTNAQSIGNTLHTIGWLYEVQGDYENALKYYEESVSTKRRVKKLDVNNLTHTLFNLGVVYDKLEKIKEAMRAFEEICVLQNKEANFNAMPNMQIIGEALNSIGTLYFKQSKLNEALKCFQDSLIYFAKYGLDSHHPSFKKALNNQNIVKLELESQNKIAIGEDGEKTNNDLIVDDEIQMKKPMFYYK